MMKMWKEENASRFEKDFIGRLVAIAGLLIVVIATYQGFRNYSDYIAEFGFALLLIGKVIISRAAYKPNKRMQDTIETGTNIIEKISHWF